MSLKTEVMHALEVLDLNDRDLRSITICCNGNYSLGSDRDIREQILKILNILLREGAIYKQTISMKTLENHKNFIIYSIKNPF